MKGNWKAYLFWVGVAELIGVLSGFLSRNAVISFGLTVIQPTLSPPAVVFPVVWTVLYGLMGISAAIVWLSPDSVLRRRGLNLFIAQLIVNFFWSLIFFNAGAYGAALVWLVILWILVLWMIISFWQVDRGAALLQIPYLIWLTFAAYLNYGVWKLNP